MERIHIDLKKIVIFSPTLNSILYNYKVFSSTSACFWQRCVKWLFLWGSFVVLFFSKLNVSISDFPPLTVEEWNVPTQLGVSERASPAVETRFVRECTMFYTRQQNRYGFQKAVIKKILTTTMATMTVIHLVILMLQGTKWNSNRYTIQV